ncbi:glycosyltransferase [Allohahella sp. A8]|uniref:glycosyltransferase n=1 Tax=Allohahella sp. A8 TaxID=3141461 RepID=UPI003A8012CF
MPKEMISVSPAEPRTVLVAGTYSATDAYPNTKYRLSLLQKQAYLTVTERNFPSSNKLSYDSQAGRIISLLFAALKLTAATLAASFSVLRFRNKDVLYVPYPSPLLLFTLSLLPKSARPKSIIADVFISLYDTAVVDRRLFSASGIFAKILLYMERRAYLVAHCLVTDTPENSEYYSKLFDIPAESFTAIPLSINEAVFKPSPDKKKGNRFKVLFAGTMVPLQGIRTICEAIAKVDSSLPIDFLFVGDGQDSAILENFFLNAPERFELQYQWERKWQDSDSLAALIQSADLCLGIFGDQAKTNRVWPLKNYLYMACGKTLITSDTKVAKRLQENTQGHPFAMVSPANPSQLARTIQTLYADPAQIHSIGECARAFFTEHLSSRASNEKFLKLFDQR